MGNTFLTAATQRDARTWNDALSHSTTGNTILDYFYRVGSLRGRSEEQVNADLAGIFAQDEELALKVVFYNRLITRRVKGFQATDTVQRGQGNKDEFVKTLKWLENNYPKLLYRNLWLIPSVGSWKDLWYDSAATGYSYYVNPQLVYELVERGIKNPYHCALVAKYLPKIRSKSQTKSDRHRRLNAWARGLCGYLGWSERDYRKFKSSQINSAHDFQRKICAGDFDGLDFSLLPGKALYNIISRHGKDGLGLLQRHGLEDRFLEWIKKQPTANFTGYPYELYRAARGKRNLIQKYTYDAQFKTLLERAKQDVPPELLNKGVLCALDTSGSMSSPVTGDVEAVDICVSLGIFFSSLLTGSFADHVIMFDSNSKFLKLQGNFCDKVDQIAQSAVAWGSTNFQSVIDEIVRVRLQNPQIPVKDYPGVLLVVSDMQFNPADSVSRYSMFNASNPTLEKTNYETAMQKLAAVGLPPMTIIWWQVNGDNVTDVPSTVTDPGTVLISGFDPSIVTTILGGEQVVDEKTGEVRKATPEEAMLKALDQEILNEIEV